jgi:hypothetical protein
VIREYLIKWQGYDADQNRWEPAENITPDLLLDYNRKLENSDKPLRRQRNAKRGR